MLLQRLFVSRFAVGDGRATQQVRQIAARVLHLVDLLVRPFAGGVGIRRQVIERAPDATTWVRVASSAHKSVNRSLIKAMRAGSNVDVFEKHSASELNR